MDQHSGHLSDAEIEQYGSTVYATGPKAEDRDEVIEAHLADCPSCRDRLLMSQRARLALLTDSPVNTAAHTGSSGPHPPAPEDRGPDCPLEDDLRDLAAGLSPPDQGAKLTQHAAQCDHCGPLLRMYTEDFSDELSKEDEALLGKLKSASAAWQKRLAKQVLASSGRTTVKSAKKPFSWKWMLAPTAVAACAAIAFAVWYSQRETPEKVEKLLAQAYTEKRTLEMRIPYARHADFHQLRSGDAESLLNSPASLRKATDEIASQLKANPDDPKWLLLSARLDLLDWHYKPALASLDKIEDDKVTDSNEMRLTRTLALYEKAEIEHDPQAYGEVVDLMGKTLQKNPDDPLALFNQAVACEKLYMYECASSDYARFLKVEKDSGWSGEAEEHLKRIQEKKTLGP